VVKKGKLKALNYYAKFIEIAAPKGTIGYFTIPRECLAKDSRRIRISSGTAVFSFKIKEKNPGMPR
jgi:hypothetical protein